MIDLKEKTNNASILKRALLARVRRALLTATFAMLGLNHFGHLSAMYIAPFESNTSNEGKNTKKQTIVLNDSDPSIKTKALIIKSLSNGFQTLQTFEFPEARPFFLQKSDKISEILYQISENFDNEPSIAKFLKKLEFISRQINKTLFIETLFPKIASREIFKRVDLVRSFSETISEFEVFVLNGGNNGENHHRDIRDLIEGCREQIETAHAMLDRERYRDLTGAKNALGMCWKTLMESAKDLAVVADQKNVYGVLCGIDILLKDPDEMKRRMGHLLMSSFASLEPWVCKGNNQQLRNCVCNFWEAYQAYGKRNNQKLQTPNLSQIITNMKQSIPSPEILISSLMLYSDTKVFLNWKEIEKDTNKNKDSVFEQLQKNIQSENSLSLPFFPISQERIFGNNSLKVLPLNQNVCIKDGFVMFKDKNLPEKRELFLSLAPSKDVLVTIGYVEEQYALWKQSQNHNQDQKDNEMPWMKGYKNFVKELSFCPVKLEPSLGWDERRGDFFLKEPLTQEMWVQTGLDFLWQKSLYAVNDYIQKIICEHYASFVERRQKFKKDEQEIEERFATLKTSFLPSFPKK